MSPKGAFSIDHLTQKFHLSPLGGADTERQNSSAPIAFVCLSLSHLTAIDGTKGGVINSQRRIQHVIFD